MLKGTDHKLSLSCTVCIGPRQQHQHWYLMFASNTCTVEFLSKDTVSITSLTALWNSVTLPSTCQEHTLYDVTTISTAETTPFAFMEGTGGVAGAKFNAIFNQWRPTFFLTQILRNRSFENFSLVRAFSAINNRHKGNLVSPTPLIHHTILGHASSWTRSRGKQHTLFKWMGLFIEKGTLEYSTKLTLRSA